MYLIKCDDPNLGKCCVFVSESDFINKNKDILKIANITVNFDDCIYYYEQTKDLDKIDWKQLEEEWHLFNSYWLEQDYEDEIAMTEVLKYFKRKGK